MRNQAAFKRKSDDKGMCQWRGVVSRQHPNLSWSQAKVLGEYSYGMGIARRRGLGGSAAFIGQLKGEAENTDRTTTTAGVVLRCAGQGRQRRPEVEVTASIARLLAWV